MAFVTRFQIEKLTSTGNALFLEHVGGSEGMAWTNDRDRALEYSDAEEAQEDADRYGGDVFEFTRYSKYADPVRPSQLEIVRGANLQAAE